MKFKLSVLTLLIVGLVIGLSANAFAALIITETAAPAVFAPGTKDFVIGTFNIKTAGGDAAMTLDKIYMNGVAAANPLLANSITALNLYRDWNGDGALSNAEKALGALATATSAEIGQFIAAVGTDPLTLAGTDSWDADITNLTVAAAGATPLYFILTADIAGLNGTAQFVDNTTNVQVDVWAAVVTGAGTNPAANTALTAGAAAVTATHLRWNAAIMDLLIARGGETVIKAGTADNTTLLSAVDDYGNIDADINGATREVAITAVKYLDTGTAAVATVTATGGAGNLGLTAALINDANGHFVNGKMVYDSAVDAEDDIQVLTLNNAGDEAVTLVATEETSALVGTITVCINAAAAGGTFPAFTGITAFRGI